RLPCSLFYRSDRESDRRLFAPGPGPERTSCRAQISRIWARSGPVPVLQGPSFAPTPHDIRRAAARPHGQRLLVAGVFRGRGVLQVRPGWAVPAAAGVTGPG